MAKDIEITIHQADLGDAESEFGLTDDDLKLFDGKGKIRVDVFVDGELTDLVEAPDKSIIATAPLKRERDMLTVVVTTRQGNMISLLQYDAKKKQFRKPVGESAVDESKEDQPTLVNVIETLNNVIDGAANKIVAAIHSQKRAGRNPKTDTKETANKK
jgi:hypothetical protein